MALVSPFRYLYVHEEGRQVPNPHLKNAFLYYWN